MFVIATYMIRTLEEGRRILRHTMCTVRCQVLTDEGMTDGVEECSAKHCEELDQPGDMVSCSAIGSIDAVVLIHYFTATATT